MNVSGTFTPPLDDKDLADIRCYLERYPEWPSGPDYDRAQRIESKLLDWGKALWRAVFKDEARDVYRQFERKSDVAHLLTIQANDSRVLQLPWRLLAEEDGFLFAKGINIRRRLPISLDAKGSPQFALPIRVLMVVSRPDDKDVGFLDPRSSAQALLDRWTNWAMRCRCSSCARRRLPHSTKHCMTASVLLAHTTSCTSTGTASIAPTSASATAV